MTVSLGLFSSVLRLTCLALVLRHRAPGRYGDFWKIWGEQPRLWLIGATSSFAASFLIDVGRTVFPEQARTIMGVLGFGTLIVGGFGVWWLLRKTTLR